MSFERRISSLPLYTRNLHMVSDFWARIYVRKEQ